jgi:hypothetical protein
MSFDKSDWDRRLEKIRARRVAEQAPELRRVEMAGIAQEKLEGLSEEWKPFLQYVKAQRELHENKRLDLHRLWEENLDLSHEALLGLTLEMQRSLAAREALDGVIGLPRKLIEDGKQAKERLREAR